MPRLIVKKLLYGLLVLAGVVVLVFFLFQGFALLGNFFAFRFEVVHMEAEHVRVLDGVGDGIGVA